MKTFAHHLKSRGLLPCGYPLLFAALIVALSLASAAPARAAARVAYNVETHTESWMPIRQADLEQAVVGAIVETLSGPGALNLAPLTRDKRGEPALDGVDLTLDVHIDIVGEAGNATITLTLRPVNDPTLPSFAGAATASISGVPKPKMLARILAAARQGAQRVSAALAPHLMSPGAAQAEAEAEAAPQDLGQLLDWGRIRPPKPRLTSKEMRLLGNVRGDRYKRMNAAKALGDQAFDNAEVRKLFERVALTDPDPLIRFFAVRGLGPVSRKNPFTQKVLLAVLRQDQDPKVKREALELSDSFLALSPRRTLQTWVYLLTVPAGELYRYVSGGHNEGPGFEKIAERLEPYPDAPNLDLALTACLLAPEVDQRLLEKRQKTCLELTEKLHPSRRFAVLRPYLDRPMMELASLIRDDRYTDCRNILDRGEPLGRALDMALHGRCQDVVAAQRIALRLVEDSPRPQVTCGLLANLNSSFPRPALLDAYERVLERERDAHLRSRAFAGLKALALSDLPPWGGALLPRIQARLEKMLAQHKAWYGFPPERSKRSDFVDKVPKDEKFQVTVAHNTHGEVLRLLEDLKDTGVQAEAKARAKLSTPDGQPTLAAVTYLTRCIHDSGSKDVHLNASYQKGYCKDGPDSAPCQKIRTRLLERKVRGCANDLRRIVFFFPALRHQALDALSGILAHPRAKDRADLPFYRAGIVAKKTLKQVEEMMQQGYTPPKDRRPGYGGRGPRWLPSDMRKVCLPDL